MKFILTSVLLYLSFGLYAQSTSWTENKLKEYWNKNGAFENEGIYECEGNVISLLKTSNGYSMIYLSGPNTLLWKVGDIRGNITLTATPSLFKCKLYIKDIGNRDITQKDVISDTMDLYVKFENSMMTLLWEDFTLDYIFIKLYPTANDNVGQSSNKTRSLSGTGFGISSNGIIVTNFHVIDGAKTIKVRGVNSDFNKTYKAKVLVSDKNNDLALIQIDDNGFGSLGMIPYTIKTGLAGVGESVFVLGYPLRATMGDEIKLTNGIVSARTGFQDDITSYQISAPIQPGNSGGPLFDSRGNLIGIINAKHSDAESVSYAVKSSYLMSLIELLQNPIELQTVNSLTEKSLTQQAETIKKWVYIIEAENKK